MENGGRSSPQPRLPLAVSRDDRRRADAQKVLDAYIAMASRPEMDIIRDPKSDRLYVNQIVNSLTRLIVKNTRSASIPTYGCLGVPAPKMLGTSTAVFNTICDNLRKSKTIVDSSAFSAWRAQTTQPSMQQQTERAAATERVAAAQRATAA
jgi:hypothetical protein